MRRIFLKLTLLLVLLCVIAVAGVSLLIANIDLNKVKPQIQQVVYNNSNIALAIDGPIDWVFNWQTMPSLSISVGKTRAYLDTPLDQLVGIDNHADTNNADGSPINKQQHFGDIEAFTFGITLTELLSGQVNADELSISGLTLRLNKDQQGNANWESIGSQTSSTAPSTDKALDQPNQQADKSSLFTLNALVMDRVQLDNIQVQYTDQQSKQQQTFIIESLSANDVNLQGNSFDLNTQFKLNNTAIDLNSDIALSGFLTTQTDLASASHKQAQQIAASNINAKIHIAQQSSSDTQAISLKGNGSYRLNDNAFVLDNIIVASDYSELALTLNATPTASDTSTALDINGKLNLKISDIQKQLNALGQSAIATSDSKALNSFSLNADIGGQIADKKQTLSLANMNAALDDSTIEGALSLLLRETQKPTLSSRLTIDAINLDRYRAGTAAEQPDTNSSARAASTTSNDNFDFAFLDIANILATTNINQLTLNELDFSQLNTEININNGDLKHAHINGQFYSASINVDATLKRKQGSKPLLSVKQSVQGLDVAALIEAFLNDSDKSKVLSGTANTESNLNMQGYNLQDWLTSLSGNTTIALSDGIYHSDNIEHRICQAVALARNERLKTNWPPETPLKNVTANINWQNGLGQLTAVKGGLENVTLDGKGSINLISSRYAIDLDATITGASSESNTPSQTAEQAASTQQATEATPQLNNSDPACVINERYRDIAWPILCEGSLADTSEQQGGCSVNRNKVNSLIKTAIKEKAREKAKTAIEKTIDKELGDKLDEGIKDLIKGGLEGLFK